MSKQRILISGASTGIGFATAVELAAKGHEVYAGVRKASDGERLQKANSQIRTLILDVTVPESVDAAVARVRADSVTESRARLVLINNAGIAVAGPIECLPLAEFRKQFEVNVFGLIDMTQKFLPLIRETGGRIVNISSISGRLAAPFLGPYSASKFAVEGLTDSLRRELAPQGISVSLIEPGPIRTPIWEKGLSGKDDLLAQIPTERLGIYETRLRKFVEYTAKTAASADPVEVVVRAIEHAAFAKKPRARYFVGGQSKAGNIVSRLPTGWVDGLIRLSARGL